jgi:hypothetical protein
MLLTSADELCKNNGRSLPIRVGQPAIGAPTIPLKKATKLLSVTALPSAVDRPSEIKGEWFVARVRGQHEAVLVEALNALGLGWFLPFTDGRRIDSQGKSRLFRRVLFASYVPFCCRFPIDAYGVRELDCVCQTIVPPVQSRFIKELDQLSQVLDSGYQIDPYPEMVKGRRCRVHSGPLRGIEGELESRNDSTGTVALKTQVLGHGVVRVPIDVIEVID